jgi:hypothetical protein
MIERTPCPDGFALERGHKRFGAHWLASELYQELGPNPAGQIREPLLHTRITDPREQVELLLAVMERMAWLLTVSELLDDWFDRWERMAGIAAAVLRLRPQLAPEQVAPLWRLAHQLDVVGLIDPLAEMTWAFLEHSDLPAPAGRVLRRIRIALGAAPAEVSLHLELLAWLDPWNPTASTAPVLADYFAFPPARRERWRPVLALAAQAALPGRRSRKWTSRVRTAVAQVPAAELTQFMSQWMASITGVPLARGLAAIARAAGLPGKPAPTPRPKRPAAAAPAESLVAQTLIGLAPPGAIEQRQGEIEVRGRLDQYLIHVESRTVRRQSDGALLELDPARMDPHSRQYMEAVHHGYTGLLMLALVLSEDTRYDFFRVARLV